MAKESSLWNWLSKNCLKVFRADLHMDRVENSTMLGMADVEGCLTGDQFWFELKVALRPSKPESKVVFQSKLKIEQVEWAKRRCRAGGNAWFLIQVGNGYSRSLYLIWGTHGAILKAGVTEKQLRALSVIEPNSKADAIVRRATCEL